MFVIGVCDDQNEICLQLNAIIRQYEHNIQSHFHIEIFHSAEKVIDYIESGKSMDLLFLDIELKWLNGVELGIRIREQYHDESTQIVYISAKDSYALSLFQVRPLHFLIKPIQEERVFNVIELALKLNFKSHYFYYKIGHTAYKKQIKDILYFESFGRQVQMVGTSDALLIYDKLDHISKELKDFHFLWIHKSVLVNYHHITKFAYDHVIMTNGTILNISQSRRKLIRSAQLDLEKEFY